MTNHAHNGRSNRKLGKYDEVPQALVELVAGIKPLGGATTNRESNDLQVDKFRLRLEKTKKLQETRGEREL